MQDAYRDHVDRCNGRNDDQLRSPWEAIEAVRQYFARPPKSASLAIEDMRAEKEGEEDVAFAAGTLTP